MRDTSQIAKLAALRAKTDRDLAILIDCELSRAFAGGTEFARAGEKIAKLLPIASLSPDRRAILETKLKALHLRLDRVPPGEIPPGLPCSP